MATISVDDLSLIITGSVEQNKYLVLVDGTAVRLTHVPMLAFCDLVKARLTTASGRTSLPSLFGDSTSLPVTIHRLRRAFDATVGEGAGERLIRSAGRGEYLLAIPALSVSVDADVAELSPNHLSESLVKVLLKAPPRPLCKADESTL